MGDRYRLVGSVEPDSRIDQVEYAPGEFLTLHDPDVDRVGNIVELEPDQVDRLRRYVVLEQVDEDDIPLGAPDVAVDQPGLVQSSTSTVGATGTVPDVDSMNNTELRAEVARVRDLTPSALPEIKGNSSSGDMQAALKDYYAKGGLV